MSGLIVVEDKLVVVANDTDRALLPVDLCLVNTMTYICPGNLPRHRSGAKKEYKLHYMASRWSPGTDVIDKGHRLVRAFDKINRVKMVMDYSMEELASVVSMHVNDVFHVLQWREGLVVVHGSSICYLRKACTALHGIRLKLIKAHTAASAVLLRKDDQLALGPRAMVVRETQSSSGVIHYEFDSADILTLVRLKTQLE